MEETKQAIKLAMKAMEERFGSFELKEGEDLVFVFNNCVLIMSMDENSQVSMKFLGDAPFFVDHEFGMFPSREEE